MWLLRRQSPGAGLLPAGAILRLGSTGLRHPDLLTHLRFSPDGKDLISYGHGKVRRWDVRTGNSVDSANPLRDIKTTYSKTLLAPDGTRLIAPYVEFNPVRFSVRDYDLATGRHTELFVIPPRTGPDDQPYVIGSEHFALSPDGTVLVEGHRHEAYLWDLKTGQVRHRLALPCTAYYQFVFTPDGKHLLTAGA